MELLICGSAAAEGIPAIFCNCSVCIKARKLQGKELRSRCQYILGDEILIDFGPDVNFHIQRYNLSSDRWKHLLVTHSHFDHFTPQELLWRQSGFSSIPASSILDIYGNDKVASLLYYTLKENLPKYKVNFHKLKLWQPVKLSKDIIAIPILAAHDATEECLNYILEVNGKTVLIANDTGWYDDMTWRFLASFKFDVVFMDCTSGIQDIKDGHLSCRWLIRAYDYLAKLGSLSNSCRFFANHFSHNGNLLHYELEEYFRAYNIEVSYDGLKIDL